MNRLLVLILLAVPMLAQTKSEAQDLPRETLLELRLVEKDLAEYAAAVQRIYDLLVAPMQQKQNALVMKACVAAGFTPEEVQTRKCIVDVAAGKIIRATEKEKKN